MRLPIFMSATLALLVMPGCWRGADYQFAIEKCDFQKFNLTGNAVFEKCIPQKFPIGSEVSDLMRYIQGAGFESLKNDSLSTGKQYFLLKQDWEKGPREKLIVFEHREQKIAAISAHEWKSFWTGEGRPKSPFSKYK